MNYNQAIRYLDEKASLGSVPGLESIIELMRRLGNPQDSLHFVHVAGSNGKGSVCAYLSAILGEAGISFCTYTSPAVFDYRERYVCNGKKITQKDFAALLSRVAKASDAMEAEGRPHPTVFEMETALFFLYALEKEAKLCILECGMGGLLDATNLIKTTQVCVFASISMDHMSFLGSNLSAIAGQKAGILKPGAEAVIGLMDKAAVDVLKTACREKEVPSTCVARGDITKEKYSLRGTRFTYKNYRDLTTSLTGTFQPENAALALEAALALSRTGYSIGEEAIRRGLARAIWPGRLMYIPGKPAYILDGAHNTDAARRLRESLENLAAEKRKILVFGMFADKEYEEVARILTPLFEQVVTITPPNPRALAGTDLATCVKKYNPQVTSMSSIEEGLEVAGMLAGPKDLIVCCGSLSFLGRVQSLVADSKRK